MRHIKTFEAVIIPNKLESDNKITNYNELEEYGLANNFDVVQYDEFYDSLDEANKKTAPSKDPRCPFFALFNPTTNKPMFVINGHKSIVENMSKMMDFKEIVNDIIGHEMVHKGQNERRTITYTLPSPTQKKEYFSCSDEIMAFAWTIANGLKKDYKSFEDAVNFVSSKSDVVQNQRHKPYLSIWGEVKTLCDIKVVNKYRKYIYEYLENLYDHKIVNKLQDKINKK